MRPAILCALLAAAVAAPVSAKLPPPSDEAKAKAAEAAPKAAWSNKVGAYHLCRAMDRVAQAYRGGAASAPAPVATPACADPGPYVASAADAKPLEASGAHSPPAMATSPPGSKATSAELTGKTK